MSLKAHKVNLLGKVNILLTRSQAWEDETRPPMDG